MARVPLPSADEKEIRSLSDEIVRQQAVATAAAIAIRAIGSGMALIASGYGAESAGPTRRLTEVKLNTMKIVDSPTGDYARRYMQGRGKKLRSLVAEYKTGGGVHGLSNYVHATPVGLIPITVVEGKPGLVLEPARQDRRSRGALFIFAFEVVQICEWLPKPFGFRWAMPDGLGKALQRAGADLGRKVHLRTFPGE